MDISDLIRTLARLEEQKLLSPREFLSHQGLENASDVLSLYEKGLEYGLPQESLKTLFTTPKTLPTTPEAPEAPEAPDVGDFEVVELPPFTFLNNPEIHMVLSCLTDTDEITLSGFQICYLSDVEPTKGVLRKITSALDSVGFKSRLENDPTRPIRTRTRFYNIDLTQLGGLSDLWSFLSERRESKSWKVPIAIYDYLDGTESGLRFINDDKGEELSLVLQSYNFDRFRNTLAPLYKRVYGKSLETLIKNDGVNKYLLSRAMMEAFPIVSLKRLLEDRVSSDRRSEIRGIVKHSLQHIKVSQSIFDEDWTSLDSTLSGFVYLIACMIIDYNINGD